MMSERTCDNCCFGVKDPRSNPNLRYCAMSKKKDTHLADTKAAEINCKHHLYKVVKHD